MHHHVRAGAGRRGEHGNAALVGAPRAGVVASLAQRNAQECAQHGHAREAGVALRQRNGTSVQLSRLSEPALSLQRFSLADHRLAARAGVGRRERVNARPGGHRLDVGEELGIRCRRSGVAARQERLDRAAQQAQAAQPARVDAGDRGVQQLRAAARLERRAPRAGKQPHVLRHQRHAVDGHLARKRVVPRRGRQRDGNAQHHTLQLNRAQRAQRRPWGEQRAERHAQHALAVEGVERVRQQRRVGVVEILGVAGEPLLTRQQLALVRGGRAAQRHLQRRLQVRYEHVVHCVGDRRHRGRHERCNQSGTQRDGFRARPPGAAVAQRRVAGEGDHLAAAGGADEEEVARPVRHDGGEQRKEGASRLI